MSILQTRESIAIIGTLLGVLLASLGNTAVPTVFVDALGNPLLFLMLYGSLALLIGIEIFILRKTAPLTPVSFAIGPLLMIAVVTFVYLSILVPDFS